VNASGPGITGTDQPKEAEICITSWSLIPRTRPCASQQLVFLTARSKPANLIVRLVTPIVFQKRKYGMIRRRKTLLISAFLLSGISTPGLGSETGGWTTGGIVDAWADFALPVFSSDRLFLLSCTERVDEDLIEYMVLADDRIYPITFSEGGAILVEARGPRVQQITPGTAPPCSVQLFPEAFNQSVSFTFEARHAVPEQVLALHPDRQRRFRIDFEIPALPDLPECSRITLRPFVNGSNVMTPDNRPLDLQAGTSFWGLGHSVSVTTANGIGGDCPTNAPIRSRITIHPF